MFKVGGLKSVSRHVDIKYEVVELLEDNNVPEAVIGQVVKLMTELREIAAGHRIDLEVLRDCDTSPKCKKYKERVGNNETN